MQLTVSSRIRILLTGAAVLALGAGGAFASPVMVRHLDLAGETTAAAAGQAAIIRVSDDINDPATSGVAEGEAGGEDAGGDEGSTDDGGATDDGEGDTDWGGDPATDEPAFEGETGSDDGTGGEVTVGGWPDGEGIDDDGAVDAGDDGTVVDDTGELVDPRPEDCINCRGDDDVIAIDDPISEDVPVEAEEPVSGEEPVMIDDPEYVYDFTPPTDDGVLADPDVIFQTTGIDMPMAQPGARAQRNASIGGTTRDGGGSGFCGMAATAREQVACRQDMR